jgi:hypothetical protein
MQEDGLIGNNVPAPKGAVCEIPQLNVAFGVFQARYSEKEQRRHII